MFPRRIQPAAALSWAAFRRGKKRLFSCFAAVSLLCGTRVYAQEQSFEIKTVAPGVYAAMAKPTFRTNANAAIILLGDSILVVDTESKPSAAKAVIAEIRRLSDKPVKYVVITHFHGDHAQGAGEYRREWPGVQIISTEETRKSIKERLIPRMKRERLGLPARIAKLKEDFEKASDVQAKKEIQEKILGGQAYLAELESMNEDLILPDVTIDRSMFLHGSSRDVEILSLGKAHTDGDLFVYVPAAKVIVTGDALHGATPSMADSSPYEWIQTLEVAERLDFEYAIGGHGEVQHGKQTFDLWRQYFTELLAAAGQDCAAGASLEDARKGIAQQLLAHYEGKFPAGGAGPFPKTVFDNVEKSYQVVCGAQVSNPITH